MLHCTMEALPESFMYIIIVCSESFQESTEPVAQQRSSQLTACSWQALLPLVTQLRLPDRWRISQQQQPAPSHLPPGRCLSVLGLLYHHSTAEDHPSQGLTHHAQGSWSGKSHARSKQPSIAQQIW